PNTVSADLPNGPGSGIGTLPPATYTPPPAVSPPAGVNTLPKAGSDALTRPTDFSPRNTSGPNGLTGPNSLLNPGNVVGPNSVVGTNGVIGAGGVTGSNGITGTSGSSLPQLPPPTSSLPSSSSTPSTLPSSSLSDSTPLTPPPVSGRTSGTGTNTDLTSYDLTPETTPDLTPELTPDLLPGTSPDTSGATNDLPNNLGGPKGSSSAPDPSTIGGSNGTGSANFSDDVSADTDADGAQGQRQDDGTGQEAPGRGAGGRSTGGQPGLDDTAHQRTDGVPNQADADADAVAPPTPIATSAGSNTPAPAAGNQGTQQGNSGTGNSSQQPSQNGPAEPGDADVLPGGQEAGQADAEAGQETADGTESPAPPQPRGTGSDDNARTPGGGRNTTGPEEAPAAPEAVRTSSDLSTGGVTDETTGDLGAETGTGLSAGPTPQSAVPVADPVRPEQWRSGRIDAPATAVRIDPPSDAGRTPADTTPLDGPETPVRAWVQRIQADDGRWLSNVSLHLPVRTGEGFSPAEVDALQERMRTLLDTHLNHGLQLPGSGDQFHLDVTLTAAPDHAEAVELSRTVTPEGSDHLNWRLQSTDPATSPEEAAERRTRDDAAVLQQLLGYAGIPDRGPEAEALLRRLVRQSDTGTGTPGPAVPQHFLQAVESVVTSAAVADHPLTARGTRPPSGIDDPAHALRTPTAGSVDTEAPVRAAVPFRTTSAAPTETGTPSRTPASATDSDADVRPAARQEAIAQGVEETPPAAVPLATEGRGDGRGPTPGAGKGKGRSTDQETASAGEPVLLDFPGSAAVDDAVDAARREHEDAVAAFGRAARTVSTLDARVTSGRGGTDDTARLYGAWQDLSTAQRRLDAALDRLRDLGADAAHDAAVASIVPRVSRTAAERRLTAALVTADDLPTDPPRPAPDALVTPEELAAAGVTPDQGPALEAQLNGSVRFEDSGITDPVQWVRLLMNRPGPWSEALDGIAARASRRTWSAAHENFALDALRGAGVPAGTDPAEAWRRATSLVLPLELHPVLADSRHARGDYLDAVRQVAQHLAVHGADAVSGTELAARVRRELGLPPRLPGGAPASDQSYAAAELERLALLEEPGATPDIDGLTRRVLHLPTDSEVSAGQRAQLLVTVENAMAAGWSSSVDALGAYHLATGGALDHGRHIMAANGAYQGLNLTGRPVGPVDTTQVWQRRNGQFQGPLDPLWDAGTGAYVVVADGGHDHVMLPWGQGQIQVSWREFAELVAHDPGIVGLPADTPVVLVLAHGGDQGLALPRTLAFRTGRDGVWAHSGQVGLVADPATGVERIVVENRRSEGLPLGGWFGSDADDLGPGGVADEGFVTALNGTILPDAALKTRTIGDDGRSIGRVTMSDPDLVTNEPMLESMAEITEFVQFDPVSEGAIGEPAALLENGRPVYHFAQHGQPLRGVMEVADGSPPVQVGGEETGRYIRRRPSMRKLGPNAVIDLGSCWADATAEDLPYLSDAGEPPYVFDTLGTTSYAQGVANGSGAGVMAVDRVHVLMRGATPKAGALASPSGEQGVRSLLLPEPGPAGLAALARTAHLHTGDGPVPADVLDTTLRLVKALRRSFGADVASDGRFEALLRGIGALENMRRADPHLRVLGPFTLHHLHLVTHARHQRTSNDPPSRDDVRRVLLDAAGKREEAAAGRLTLHQYTPMPSLDWALKRLAGRDLAALAADVLRLPDAGAVSRADVSRLVWGAVKGAEALRSVTDPVALAKKALHLPGSAAPTPDEAGDRLLWLMAGAAVTGFDPADPTELAAWDLVRHGALDDSTLLTAGGVPTGRNWTRGTVTGDIATEGYLVSPDGGPDGATPHPAPWPDAPRGSAAKAYVLTADSTNGHVAMPWTDGSSRWVPGSEIAALLRHDRVHQQIALRAPLLVIGSHTNPGSLAQHIAGRAGTARTTLLSELPGALVPHPVNGRNTIVLTEGTAARTDHWQTRRPAALPGVSAQQGPLHTFTGRAPGTESSTAVATSSTAPAPAPLSQYIRDHGRRHDGHVGLVLHEPTPDTVLDGLHRSIVEALGADPETTGGQRLLTRLQDVLSAEEIELNRPYLRSRQGYRITLRHGGRDRTVDVRLSYADPVRSTKYGGDTGGRPPTLPDMGVEARAGGGQSTSHVEGSGNIRTGSVPWSGIFPDDRAGALRWWDSTVNVSATHNQLTQSVTVGETFLVTSKQQAEEPAHPMDVDGRWQIQVDTPREGETDNWQAEQSHGALTIWFHEHLAFDGDDTTALPEPGDVDDLPLWGGDSVAEPRRLLTELLQDDTFAALRDLDEDSERALENFLSQRMLQGTPHLQRDGGVFSPTLLDGDGNAVGVLELTAVIEPGPPMRKSADGRSSLETWFSHASSVDKSAKLTSGMGVEAAGGPAFTTDHTPGHPAAASSFGGNLVGKAAVNWQLTDQLSNVSSATLMHGLRTKSSHLLTSGRVAYTATLHRAGGGRISSTFGPWTDGLRLRIAQRATMAGHRPTPAELRELPEHLENLESIGYTETPLKVDGADPLFTAAEAWLRREGFLPPVRHRSRSAVFRLDEPLVVAQLENLRRLRQMRSTYGLASSAPDAVDGGESVWFERPNAVSGTRRVQLVFSAARDTTRPAVHTRRLPDVLHVGSSSYESGGARQRGTALSGALGGGGGLNAPIDQGSWGLNTAPDYLGTRQLTDASSTAGQVGYDQFTMTTRNGSELFEVPARLGLDLYEGTGEDPLVRFAETDADGNPARPEAEPEAEDDLEMQIGAAGTPTVPGSVRLLVPHYRTR
ncbi:lonely Cys domain-containing protein, partial [Streptomyces albovinaceus]